MATLFNTHSCPMRLVVWPVIHSLFHLFIGSFILVCRKDFPTSHQTSQHYWSNGFRLILKYMSCRITCTPHIYERIAVALPERFYAMCTLQVAIMATPGIDLRSPPQSVPGFSLLGNTCSLLTYISLGMGSLTDVDQELLRPLSPQKRVLIGLCPQID